MRTLKQSFKLAGNSHDQVANRVCSLIDIRSWRHGLASIRPHRAVSLANTLLEAIQVIVLSTENVLKIASRTLISAPDHEERRQGRFSCK